MVEEEMDCWMDAMDFWIISYEYISGAGPVCDSYGRVILRASFRLVSCLIFGLTMFSLLLLILVACMNRNVVACACVALLYVY